jgi:hypothetical protein
MIINYSNSPYEFDVDEYGVPAFTKKNIAFLNGILKYDSNYSTSTDENNEDNMQTYVGMLQQSNFFSFTSSVGNEERDELGNPKDILYKVIESMDKINSTHLSSEGNSKKEGEITSGKRNKGRAKMAAKIRDISGEKLETLLKQGDAGLVGTLADPSVGGKHNFSFATKFCAYVSLYALGEDNYCIYDEIVQSVLPYYAYIYVDENLFEEKYKNIYRTVKGTKANNYTSRNESLVNQYKDADDYAGYRTLINDIIKGIEQKTGNKLTYAEFDRLVWYYFKGSKSKISTAMKILPKKGD